MPIDREVLEAVREMNEHELRRLLILAKARLEQRGVTFPGAGPEVSLRAQRVKCGKATCSRCPHGPYWYAYWWENGRRRSRYVGKLDDVVPTSPPPSARRRVGPQPLPSPGDG
jgi:hypothetical protein